MTYRPWLRSHVRRRNRDEPAFFAAVQLRSFLARSRTGSRSKLARFPPVACRQRSLLVSASSLNRRNFETAWVRAGSGSRQKVVRRCSFAASLKRRVSSIGDTDLNAALSSTRRTEVQTMGSKVSNKCSTSKNPLARTDASSNNRLIALTSAAREVKEVDSVSKEA